ncbi:MAG: methyltransferase domain-containing protein [Ilumatobacter sp.]
MDPIEQRLRRYYEAEAEQRLRPAHGDRRTRICRGFATLVASEARRSVVDIGSGPASDLEPFREHGVDYVGADLALGNARLAAADDAAVVPATLFALPFRDDAFPAGWSMSAFQHVPDHRIDEALAEFVRVLEPGAPVTIGLWGGRDEVIESSYATSGIQMHRHFTLRTHERIRAILAQHMVVGDEETFPAGPSDWRYHVASARTPLR